MKKLLCALSLAFALAVVPLCAYALDSQSTTVRYSVSATVVLVDGDIQTTQKVPVGTVLKAPQPNGKEGCSFEGWQDSSTGKLWDFNAPVTGDLSLIALYKELPGKSQTAAAGYTVSEKSIAADSLAQTLQRTGDSAAFPLVALALAGLSLIVALLASSKREN